MPLEHNSSDAIHGSVLAMVLYDVGEEIRVDDLLALLSADRQRPALKHPAAQQVRIERPPAVEYLGAVESGDGDSFDTHIKYYDYGVVSVIFQRAFQGSWDDLIRLSATWIAAPQLEQLAHSLADKRLARVRSAMVKPYKQWLSEDYFIFVVDSPHDGADASTLITRYGSEIAQVVRGETSVLSNSEQQEVLQSAISYYPVDIAVIGWNAAFVYDTPTGATTAIQLLEYANSQLLEFRHYDEFLTRELNAAHDLVERGTGMAARWRLARAASRLQDVALEVTSLAERVDNAIKFLSDMFSARLYRLAAVKVGVPDYKNLVDEKLATARELYGYMIEEFHQGRAFVLELIVVIILVIELVFLFRGRS